MKHKSSTIDLPSKLEDYDGDKFILSTIKFKTLRSKQIKPRIILDSIGTIDRGKMVLKFMDYTLPKYAVAIESGLYEFCLLKLSTEPNYDPSFLEPIYKEKALDLISNIDPNHPRVQNVTLISNIEQELIDPYFLAFMRPEQLHPIRWAAEQEKRRRLEESDQEVKVSDLYTCYKCNSKKCVTSQLQTRSSDEPMTIFVTCLVCYKTFTK